MTADNGWHVHVQHSGPHGTFVHDEKGILRADKMSEADAREWLQLRAVAQLERLRWERVQDPHPFTAVAVGPHQVLSGPCSVCGGTIESPRHEQFWDQQDEAQAARELAEHLSDKAEWSR